MSSGRHTQMLSNKEKQLQALSQRLHSEEQRISYNVAKQKENLSRSINIKRLKTADKMNKDSIKDMELKIKQKKAQQIKKERDVIKVKNVEMMTKKYVDISKRVEAETLLDMYDISMQKLKIQKHLDAEKLISRRLQQSSVKHTELKKEIDRIFKSKNHKYAVMRDSKFDPLRDYKSKFEIFNVKDDADFLNQNNVSVSGDSYTDEKNSKAASQLWSKTNELERLHYSMYVKKPEKTIVKQIEKKVFDKKSDQDLDQNLDKNGVKYDQIQKQYSHGSFKNDTNQSSSYNTQEELSKNSFKFKNNSKNDKEKLLITDHKNKVNINKNDKLELIQENNDHDKKGNLLNDDLNQDQKTTFFRKNFQERPSLVAPVDSRPKLVESDKFNLISGLLLDDKSHQNKFNLNQRHSLKNEVVSHTMAQFLSKRFDYSMSPHEKKMDTQLKNISLANSKSLVQRKIGFTVMYDSETDFKVPLQYGNDKKNSLEEFHFGEEEDEEF